MEPTSNPIRAADDTLQPSINTETASTEAELNAAAPNADTHAYIATSGRGNGAFNSDGVDSSPSSNLSESELISISVLNKSA